MPTIDWSSLQPGDGLIVKSPTGKWRECTVVAARPGGRAGIRVSYDGFDSKHDEDLSPAAASARVAAGPRPREDVARRLIAAADAARNGGVGGVAGRGETCAICCIGDDDDSDTESDDELDGVGCSGVIGVMPGSGGGSDGERKMPALPRGRVGGGGAIRAAMAAASARAPSDDDNAESGGNGCGKGADDDGGKGGGGIGKGKAGNGSKPMLRLACGHAFHRACVTPWLEVRN